MLRSMLNEYIINQQSNIFFDSNVCINNKGGEIANTFDVCAVQ